MVGADTVLRQVPVKLFYLKKDASLLVTIIAATLYKKTDKIQGFIKVFSPLINFFIRE